MSEINEEILNEFKERMKISHSSEDDNLKRLLSQSHASVVNSCGKFELDNQMGKELVFERTRYVYNDALEFFANNFLTEIINLSVSLYQPDGSDGE